MLPKDRPPKAATAPLHRVDGHHADKSPDARVERQGGRHPKQPDVSTADGGGWMRQASHNLRHHSLGDRAPPEAVRAESRGAGLRSCRSSRRPATGTGSGAGSSSNGGGGGGGDSAYGNGGNGGNGGTTAGGAGSAGGNYGGGGGGGGSAGTSGTNIGGNGGAGAGGYILIEDFGALG